MPSNRVLEQHIAVFGESGSGKTVMLSSFYGSEQEPQNIKKGAFNVVAENAGQGTHLHQNYLGMKNSARVPDATKFVASRTASSSSSRARLRRSLSRPSRSRLSADNGDVVTWLE